MPSEVSSMGTGNSPLTTPKFRSGPVTSSSSQVCVNVSLSDSPTTWTSPSQYGSLNEVCSREAMAASPSDHDSPKLASYVARNSAICALRGTFRQNALNAAIPCRSMVMPTKRAASGYWSADNVPAVMIPSIACVNNAVS